VRATRRACPRARAGNNRPCLRDSVPNRCTLIRPTEGGNCELWRRSWYYTWVALQPAGGARVAGAATLPQTTQPATYQAHLRTTPTRTQLTTPHIPTRRTQQHLHIPVQLTLLPTMTHRHIPQRLTDHPIPQTLPPPIQLLKLLHRHPLPPQRQPPSRTHQHTPRTPSHIQPTIPPLTGRVQSPQRQSLLKPLLSNSPLGATTRNRSDHSARERYTRCFKVTAAFLVSVNAGEVELTTVSVPQTSYLPPTVPLASEE